MALVKSLMHFENRESISKWVQYQDNYGLEVLGEAILAEITRRENKERIPDRLELSLIRGDGTFTIGVEHFRNRTNCLTAVAYEICRKYR